MNLELCGCKENLGVRVFRENLGICVCKDYIGTHVERDNLGIRVHAFREN